LTRREAGCLPEISNLLRDCCGILATNITRLRDERGWSQEELGNQAGLHRTYVGAVERGERNVTLSTLEAFASALDVPSSSS